jgi:chromosome partitioning protein
MATSIISIVNHKGGVGKTTSAVNIGAGLNLLGKKVLLVDLDPQANLTVHLGFSPNLEKTIYGALKGKYPIPIDTVKPGLDVVVSTLDLAGAEIELSSETGREIILKELLEKVQSQYDYILIDCPPSLGLLTVNSLSASKQVIITVEPGTFSLMGMSKLFEVIDKVKNRINKELTKYKILITKYDGRKAIQKEFVEVIKQTYKDKVFNTVIRTNVTLEEATTQGVSVFETDSKSNGSEDYMNVCHEITKEN